MSSVWPGANWASAGIAKSRLPARRAHLTETKYSRHNPETDLYAFVIPQVPGSIARSTPVDGVIESLVKSKKYVLPLAYVNPWVTGSLVAVYFGGGRFHPDPHAAVFNPMVNAEAGVTMRTQSSAAAVDQAVAARQPGAVRDVSSSELPRP
jgi:hypothetical protein